MSSARTPSPTTFVPLSIFFVLLGWGGLLMLMNLSLPTLGPRWLFFFFILVALTGTMLPVTAFLNHRFTSIPPAGANVVLRQALWFGIYAATLAWLQYGRVFSSNLSLILLFGFVVIEWMLRLRERSQWNP